MGNLQINYSNKKMGIIILLLYAGSQLSDSHCGKGKGKTPTCAFERGETLSKEVEMEVSKYEEIVEESGDKVHSEIVEANKGDSTEDFCRLNRKLPTCPQNPGEAKAPHRATDKTKDSNSDKEKEQTAKRTTTLLAAAVLHKTLDYISSELA